MSIARKFRKLRNTLTQGKSLPASTESIYADTGEDATILRRLSISFAAVKAYDATGEDCAVTFRTHGKLLFAKIVKELKASTIGKFVESGSFYSEHTLSDGSRVCISTAMAGQKSATTLRLQSEYDSGNSVPCFMLDRDVLMHTGYADSPRIGSNH